MPDLPALRSISYGGGQQSTALLVLAAERAIDFPLFLFSNVGDDSEHPATLAYVEEHAKPYAALHGIELVELRRPPNKRGRFAGKVETLLARVEAGSMAIPVRRSRGGPPMSRSCTADFKTRVIERELIRRGATEDNPALVGLGISVDEAERASPGRDPRSLVQIRTYPLLERSPLDPYSPGLRLTRTMCREVIADAGLPVPPKSACWFCPFHDADAWRGLRRDTPELFERACGIERRLSESTADGRPVFLTRAGVPLDQVIGDEPSLFDGMDGCDSGYCMT